MEGEDRGVPKAVGALSDFQKPVMVMAYGLETSHTVISVGCNVYCSFTTRPWGGADTHLV